MTARRADGAPRKGGGKHARYPPSTGAKQGALILDLARDLKARGEVSIIIIAHNYGQILEVCDRINLLQHGSITFDKPTSETSVQELTDLVVAEYRAARTQKLRPDPSANARPTPRP